MAKTKVSVSGQGTMPRIQRGGGMKILFIDIETSPSLGWVWQKYETNVIEFDREWTILCASWKWLDERLVHSETAKKNDYMNDEKLIKKLHEVFDEADVIVAHNGDKFDIKKINARFIAYGLTPPSPYRTVDTLKEVRKIASFNSHKLDDLGEALGLGRKNKVDFSIWKGCIDGDEISWRTMVKYNVQDVKLLEKLYKRILPYIKHPNYGVFLEGKVCPRCGSIHLQRRGYRYTNTSKFVRLQCQDCGGWCSERLSEKEKAVLV